MKGYLRIPKETKKKKTNLGHGEASVSKAYGLTFLRRIKGRVGAPETHSEESLEPIPPSLQLHIHNHVQSL